MPRRIPILGFSGHAPCLRCLAHDVIGAGRREAVTANAVFVSAVHSRSRGTHHYCGECCRFAPKGRVRFATFPTRFHRLRLASTGVGDVSMRAFGGYMLRFGLLALSLVVLGSLVLAELRWL